MNNRRTLTLQRSLLQLLSLLLFCALFTRSASAQNNHMVHQSSAYIPGCDSMGDTVCCAVFTIDIQVHNSRWLELELDTELGDTSCFDWECTRFRSNIALPNAGGIWPLELEVVMDGSHVKIQVIGSAYPDGFPLGSVIQITLCPKWGAPEILCWEQWQHWTLRSHAADHPTENLNDQQGGEMDWCEHPWGCLTDCDKITAYRNLDIDTFGTDSWTFCVKRNNWPNAADKIKVTFDPPLDPNCNPMDWDGKEYWDFKVYCDGGTLGNQPCPFVWRGDTIWIPANDSIHIVEDRWAKSKDTVIGTEQFLEFTPAPSYNLGPCGTWCFTVVDCPTTVPRKVKIETDSPLDNDDCADSVTKSFKPSGGDSRNARVGQPSGYPNPFGPANGNATTIPFVAETTGRAVLTIANSSGSFLIIQEMELTKPGEHAFTFEANELPAGTYHYQIELPRGRVLYKSSVLLVK